MNAHGEDGDIVRARALYRDVMTPAYRANLVANVAGHLAHDVSNKVVLRAIDYWRAIDSSLGEAIARRLGVLRP
jgi:catalase